MGASIPDQIPNFGRERDVFSFVWRNQVFLQADRVIPTLPTESMTLTKSEG